MPYSVTLCDYTALMDIINGARSLGPFPRDGLALGGKTLVFTAPAAIVTFPGAVDAMVTPAAMVATLRAAIADLGVDIRTTYAMPASISGITQRLAIYRDTGFTVGSTGTANELFGLSTEADTVSAGSLAWGDGIQSIGMPSPGQFLLITRGTGLGNEDGEGVVVP